MNIPLNIYVAYFEKGILNFGYVIAQNNNRLEVITETGNYVVLPESRIILQSKEKYLESEPYQALPNFINQVNLFEEQFQESDFHFLKEKECTLQEIATKLNLQTDVQIFALFKYLHNHPKEIHCKKNKYRLKTPEEITQYQLQLQQQEEERQFLQDVNAFFSSAELSRESQHKLYNALPELQTTKKHKKLKELILSQYPLLKPEEAILEFRKFCGETPEYIDPVIANAGIPIGFSSLLIEEKLLPWKVTQPEAIAFSIDDESTKDFDDAISFTKDGSFWHLTLYVSSVSERLNLEGALFAEAKKRVSSLYTANAVIPLFPFNHSEQELSLKKDSVRPVLALNIWLDENLAIQHYELSRMNITISENYSFNEIDHQIEQEPFSTLYRLSKLLAEKRGANSFSEKERYYYYISAAEQGLEVKCVDTQSPARKIVEELMILYNSYLADYAVKKNIPVIYRNINQFEDPKDNFLSLQAYLSTEPEFHPGIGANAYLHSTSPIRRYVDLINQLQISAILQGKNPPFSKEELEKDIPLLEKRIYDIREIAHKSERYWVLKFLQQNCINIPLETYFRISIDGYLSFELTPWGFIITAKSESYPKTERCKIVIYKVDPEQGIVWVDII